MPREGRDRDPPIEGVFGNPFGPPAAAINSHAKPTEEPAIRFASATSCGILLRSARPNRLASVHR